MLLETLLQQLNESLTKEEKARKANMLPFLNAFARFKDLGENYKNILIKSIITNDRIFSVIKQHRQVISGIIDYLHSNPNIQHNISFRELEDNSNEWHEKLKQKKLKGQKIPIDPKRIVYKEGQYYIYKLTTKEECEYEGDYVGQCVGGYGDDVESGDTNIYSLRNKENNSITTIEIDNNNNVEQVYGNGPKTGNVKPDDNYGDIIMNWIIKNKFDASRVLDNFNKENVLRWLDGMSDSEIRGNIELVNFNLTKLPKTMMMSGHLDLSDNTKLTTRGLPTKLFCDELYLHQTNIGAWDLEEWYHNSKNDIQIKKGIWANHIAAPKNLKHLMNNPEDDEMEIFNR